MWLRSILLCLVVFALVQGGLSYADAGFLLRLE